MAAAKKQRFLRFLYWTESSPRLSSPQFTNYYKFGISVLSKFPGFIFKSKETC